MPIEPQVPAETEPERTEAPQKYPWYQKISAFLLIIFCLEIGCFLLVFPWMGDAWDNNFFSSLLRRGYWDNAYFRGAVSGLGVINLYISFAEMLRLRRFW
jgi:hypothetical protein